MSEIPFEYWNQLANQTILISSLLSGFSITVIVSLLVSDKANRLTNFMLIIATLAASSFLIAVFAMTRVVLMTTEGYPIQVSSKDLFYPRVTGSMCFFLGILFLILVISMAGWIKSKKVGLITSMIGLATLIMTIFQLT